MKISNPTASAIVQATGHDLQRADASSPLRRVEWLASVLDLSPCQTYDAIASKQVPDDCVVRIGRRLRIVEGRVNAWLGLHEMSSGRQTLRAG